MNDILQGFIGVPVANITRDEYAGPFFILGNGTKSMWLRGNGWCVKKGNNLLLGSDASEEYKNIYLSVFIGLYVVDMVVEFSLMLVVRFSEEVVLYVYNTCVEGGGHHVIFFDDDNGFNVSFDSCMVLDIELND